MKFVSTKARVDKKELSPKQISLWHMAVSPKHRKTFIYHKACSLCESEKDATNHKKSFKEN